MVLASLFAASRRDEFGAFNHAIVGPIEVVATERPEYGGKRGIKWVKSG